MALFYNIWHCKNKLIVHLVGDLTTRTRANKDAKYE